MGTIKIHGQSTSGTGVRIGAGSVISSSGNGSSIEISGHSTDGPGVDNDGALNATHNGTIHISGHSAHGADVTGNGSISESNGGVVRIVRKTQT
jgi:hypothetical protein